MNIAANKAWLIIALVLLTIPGFAQSTQGANPPSTGVAVNPSPTGTAQEPKGLPRGFRGIELGMSMEEVQKLLEGDSLYFYRGEPDVSLLPRPNEVLIEVAGISYVKRAFFQFYDGKLFVMIFAMNEKKIDHYSIFTEMSRKYGKPGTLSPSESVWMDGATRMSIERPLALKYIDIETFNKLKEAGQALESYEELLRTEFLDGL